MLALVNCNGVVLVAVDVYPCCKLVHMIGAIVDKDIADAIIYNARDKKGMDVMSTFSAHQSAIAC